MREPTQVGSLFFMPFFHPPRHYEKKYAPPSFLHLLSKWTQIAKNRLLLYKKRAILNNVKILLCHFTWLCFYNYQGFGHFSFEKFSINITKAHALG